MRINSMSDQKPATETAPEAPAKKRAPRRIIQTPPERGSIPRSVIRAAIRKVRLARTPEQQRKIDYAFDPEHWDD